MARFRRHPGAGAAPGRGALIQACGDGQRIGTSSGWLAGVRACRRGRDPPLLAACGLDVFGPAQINRWREILRQQRRHPLRSADAAAGAHPAPVSKGPARSAEEPAGNHNAIGAVQHCAFVVTAERFREVEGRLKSCGIDYIGPIPQLPGLLGIYFFDPNGIRLEFACQPEDGEMPAVIPCITQTKAEARAELESLRGATPEWIERRLDALPG